MCRIERELNLLSFPGTSKEEFSASSSVQKLRSAVHVETG